nr:Chain C, ILE-LEU-GLY-LYS-PHE-LEU-HIS-ARG-LEU [Homo sapiens]
ILGKFLHRL